MIILFLVTLAHQQRLPYISTLNDMTHKAVITTQFQQQQQQRSAALKPTHRVAFSAAVHPPSS